MKKRFRFVFILAAFTTAGILIFQCYWVYNSYRTGERNFKNQLLTVLQNSVSEYPLHLAVIPATLRSKSPYLTVVSSFKDAANDAPALEEKTPMKNKKFSVAFKSLAVTPENLSIVQKMIARLTAQAAGIPLQIDTLKKIFNAELEKNNIDLPCQLIIIKGKLQLPKDQIATFIGFSAKSDIVQVIPQGMGVYLFKANLLPAFISLLLIFISGGSLCYMGVIISRQMKLDELKTEFISNITHELRTPISILKSTHEALYKFGESSNPETTAKYLGINVGILDKLEENVDRMLDVARYEHGVAMIIKESVNLPELVQNSIERFQLTPGDEIQIVNQLPIDHVNTNSSAISTIITNLVDNALKYAGGYAKVEIILGSIAKGWRLTIKDHGHGIEAKYLPFIFDKFYRVPSGDLHEVKGYGIGLSHVKQLVEELGGYIEVKSKFREGTTFIIQFPAHE